MQIIDVPTDMRERCDKKATIEANKINYERELKKQPKKNSVNEPNNYEKE